MALKVYEIKIGGEWSKVKGTTSSMREGWLQWQGIENKDETGMARPGTWREPVKKEKKK